MCWLMIKSSLTFLSEKLNRLSSRFSYNKNSSLYCNLDSTSRIFNFSAKFWSHTVAFLVLCHPEDKNLLHAEKDQFSPQLCLQSQGRIVASTSSRNSGIETFSYLLENHSSSLVFFIFRVLCHFLPAVADSEAVAFHLVEKTRYVLASAFTVCIH